MDERGLAFTEHYSGFQSRMLIFNKHLHSAYSGPDTVL
jgi:hypothetical protein